MTMNHPQMMTRMEVARVFDVDPKTVSRWAQTGKLKSIRTLGGHRRFFADQVRELVERQEAQGDEFRV